jgi:hypothetical protein
VLWELHEIRHKLHNRRKHSTIEEINREALKKYAAWERERELRQREAKKSHKAVEGIAGIQGDPQ